MTSHETSAPPLRLAIVGGVAGGASAAARARRLDERAEITLFERGPDISFANCGLPYYIGDEIKDRDALSLQTPESLHQLLRIDVRLRHNVTAIDPEQKRIRVEPSDGDEAFDHTYDKLILAPGASPIRPPLPGLDDPGVHTLRNLQDMDRIKEAAQNASSAIVVGAGFIGIEMAEQLVHLGKTVTVVELQDQILPPMDPEMAQLLAQALVSRGIHLVLGDGIQSVSPTGKDSLTVHLDSGASVEGDLVILSIGVRPESDLAREAGLTLGPRGHIVVNAHQQTSDPDIYAAGDAVETADRVSGEPTVCALGGPANRQGRTAADHIFRPASARPYPGSQGTAIVRAFDAAAGLTGWSAKRLAGAGRDYRSVIVNDGHHAEYYPGAEPVLVKVIWDPADGRLLGAQVTGYKGVDKRLDVLATAITGRLTIDDLVHLELAYAPPFGSAKDPVNLAGFAATNVQDELCSVVTELPADEQVQIVDVRNTAAVQRHPLPVAHSIPIPFLTLRDRLDELDRTRPVITVCSRGKTSYFAARVLAQNGFNVQSFSGGVQGNFDPPAPGD